MTEQDEDFKRRDRALRGEKSKTDLKNEAKNAGSSPAYQGGGPFGENIGESGASRPAREVLKENEEEK